MSTLDWMTARPIAHRGLHDMNSSVWENTSTAFDRAIACGYNIECDLQITSDNAPVVFHDYKTDRLCGVEGVVKEMTAAELKELTIGSSGEHPQTLKDMLRQVDDGAGLVIELKPQSDSLTTIFATAVLEDLNDYVGRVALMSFDANLILELIRLGSPWPVGLTAEAHSDDGLHLDEDIFDSGVRFVSFHVADLPHSFVDHAKARGLPVITWTVRTEKELQLTYRHADQITFEGFDPDMQHAREQHASG